jgi:hypothetical protein
MLVLKFLLNIRFENVVKIVLPTRRNVAKTGAHPTTVSYTGPTLYISSNPKFLNTKISTDISSNFIFSNRYFVELMNFLPVKLSNIQQNFEKTKFRTFNKISKKSNKLGCSFFRANQPLRGVFIEVRCPFCVKLG